MATIKKKTKKILSKKAAPKKKAAAKPSAKQKSAKSGMLCVRCNHPERKHRQNGVMGMCWAGYGSIEACPCDEFTLQSGSSGGPYR